MAFQQILTACVINNCTELSATDITGVYDVTNNPTGWEDASTISGSDVVSATLDITFNGTATQSVDVTSQIPATVTGNIQFNDILIDAYADGVANIVYTITTATDTYTYVFSALFTCAVRCCLNKMWSKIVKEACSCKCDLKEKIDDANLAEGLYAALNRAGACGLGDSITTVLDKIKRICEFKNCNC